MKEQGGEVITVRGVHGDAIAETEGRLRSDGCGRRIDSPALRRPCMAQVLRGGNGGRKEVADAMGCLVFNLPRGALPTENV